MKHVPTIRGSALIAVGGNSLIRAGEKGTVTEQLANASRTARAIVDVIRAGYRPIITHGNGPQVGAQLLRSERASDLVYGQPLDICGAASQGEIGYVLEQCLENELATAAIAMPVVSLVTQTIVSCTDPAMQNPTKPIGPFYSRVDAEEKRRQLGWHIVEDAARGYRRVVPSPEPLEIVEVDVIRSLMARDVLVVCTGGGGIPVMRVEGQLHGVEAVIDKDRASALLAAQLGVDLFAISTDTDYVYLNYKKAGQTPLKFATIAQLEHYRAEGHFPPGNMGPKIDSVIAFLRRGGKHVVITSFQHLSGAITGNKGTQIVPDTEWARGIAFDDLEVPVLR